MSATCGKLTLIRKRLEGRPSAAITAHSLDFHS